MNPKKFFLAVLVVGVVANIFDILVHGMMLRSMYESIPVLRQDTNMVWFVVIDFIFALVLVWVYEKVKGSFTTGVAGGMLFGFYAGVFFSFPNMLSMRLMIVDLPYHLTWLWTGIGIVWYVLMGAVVGMLYKPKTA